MSIGITVTRRSVVAGASASLVAGSASAAGMSPGSSMYVAKVSTSERGYEMPVHIHVPKDGHVPKGGANRPVLFVMHGLNRNASEYRDQWRDLAETHNFVLIVPEFSKADFPDREGYNFGGMITAAGVPKPRTTWTFSLIDQVFNSFVTQAASPATGYDLYGHSAGAQFAHRFALFGSSTLARRIVSANAGAYAWPTFVRPYPYGLGGTELSQADLATFLTREAILLLGEADIDPKHASLPNDPAAQSQGPHRFARGQAFYGALKDAATAAGVTLGWRLATVPGVAHSNSGMASAAARVLYA